MLNPEQIKAEFPILNRTNGSGNKLVYLDNAATTQKPIQVINAISNFYKNHNANIHRGIHFLGTEATELYEGARDKVRSFIGAAHSEEIIFTRGTTESINLVASTYGNQKVEESDRIIVTGMEHHSNLVPWQQLAKSKNAHLDIVNVNENGEIAITELSESITDQTKMIALTHISNSLGTINKVNEITNVAHKHGIPVLLDGAQAVGHQAVDVQVIGCDFYAFSGHKMFGPTGIGVLYVKREYLEQMNPYQFGGEMIQAVSYGDTSFAKLPHRFEAGTPDISGAIGLGAAIDYLNSIGMSNVEEYTNSLTRDLLNQLEDIKGLRVVGNFVDRGSIASFTFDNIHPHDVATILDEQGIAVRAGHHCTMPLMHHLGLTGTTRASLAIYNTKEEIDLLCDGLENVKAIFD